MSDKPESMYAIPLRYARQFAFELSPTPEYRWASRDEETGIVMAEDWDGNVFVSDVKSHHSTEGEKRQ